MNIFEPMSLQIYVCRFMFAHHHTAPEFDIFKFCNLFSIPARNASCES
jgi:hypothetical protein